MLGDEMKDLIARLYPIHRSMAGEGLRRTLGIVGEWIPLEITEVPSGTPVLDWSVPREWNISDAWVKSPDGTKIIDYADSNLHVMNHSVPMHRTMALDELDRHLHSLPDRPDAIPYRTGYFSDEWGFSLPHALRSRLEPGEYEVMIDATLTDGSMTYGEVLVPGRIGDEIVLYTHTCHPSLANDNLSGIAVAAAVGRELMARPPGRFGVRIIFAPATIGSIAWLSRNIEKVPAIAAGMTLVCLGDRQPLTYKRTVSGTNRIDRVASRVLGGRSKPGRAIDFYPFGYDERQFNAPGFRVPFGSLMRSQHGTFPEYHTDADDVDFVHGDELEEAVDVVLEIIDAFSTGERYRNKAPYGEPQLGRRGLYTPVRNVPVPKDQEYAYLWLLNLSDGDHDIDDVAELSGLPIDVIRRAAETLVAADLLEALQ